jgi:deaminated glutathione amidase
MGDGRFRIACVQHCAGLDVATNLATLARLIEQAVARGADLVCLPEYCAAYGMKDGRLAVGARAEDQHEALQALGGQARRHRCWLLIGSIGVLAEDGRILNRSYLVDSDGVIRARYDKIHLFDVDLAQGESYRESSTIRPGKTATLVATPFGRLGLTVCYDLRFPHLYRALAKAGADVLFVPAAFTRTTGQAHWHVLLRARAIETGAFVLAAVAVRRGAGRQARPLRALADRDSLGRGARGRRGGGGRDRRRARSGTRRRGAAYDPRPAPRPGVRGPDDRRG